MENRYNHFLTLLFLSLITLSAKAHLVLSSHPIINPQCYLHWVQIPKRLIELNPQLTSGIQYGQTVSHWDGSFQNTIHGQTIHLHNCAPPFPAQTTHTIETHRLPEEISALWQDNRNTVPRLEAISPDLLPPLSEVAMVVSGGTPTPFSRAVQQNHLAWAYSRQVHYRYYELSPTLSEAQTASGNLYSTELSGIPEKIQHIEYSLNNKQRYWAKIAILKQVLDENSLPEDQWLVWVDNDIVINDFFTISMLDQAIEHYGDGFSLLVVKEGTKSKTPFNTGVILLRNTTIGRRLVDELWHLSSHPVHGYMGQEKTFHEQEALKIIYKGEAIQWLDKETGRSEERDYQSLGLNSHIGIIPQRDNDFNLNTWICRKCFTTAKAIREHDSFIHVPGLGENKQPEIENTLSSIRANYPYLQETKKLFLMASMSAMDLNPKILRHLASTPDTTYINAESAMLDHIEITASDELLSRLETACQTGTLFPDKLKKKLLEKHVEPLALSWLALPSCLTSQFSLEEKRRLFPMVPLPDFNDRKSSENYLHWLNELYTEQSSVDKPIMQTSTTFKNPCPLKTHYPAVNIISAHCWHHGEDFTISSFVNEASFCTQLTLVEGELRCTAYNY